MAAWRRPASVVVTPPGALIKDPERGLGIYAVENTQESALWSCSMALANRWRELIVECDEPDVLNRCGQGVLRLDGFRVLGEISAYNVRKIAAGGDKDEVLRVFLADAARDTFETLIPCLRARRSTAHGIDHWRAVLTNGLRLCADTHGADWRVVAAFAALHDARRRNDGHDPDHGPRAATLARELHRTGALPLNETQLEVLCEALTGHDRGQTSTDPTVGVCWDADRLELSRFGRRVNARYLSTEAGREAASNA